MVHCINGSLLAITHPIRRSPLLPLWASLSKSTSTCKVELYNRNASAAD